MIEATCWAAVCVGIWLLTLSSVTLADLSLAIPAGLLCGVLATAGRRLAEGRWRPQPRWAAWLLTVPVNVVVDTIGVWAAAVRAVRTRRPSGYDQVLQQPAEETEDIAATRRALATLVLSASPGSYIVDFDPDRRQLLAHTVTGKPPRWVRLEPEK
jgi:multisubunit Na+/H+ antiporter MnhE subunit